MTNLAAQYGCNFVTIHYLLKRHKITCRSRGGCTGVTTEQEKEICSRYLSGDSVEDLRDNFHCSQPVINRILYNNNIPKRSANGAKPRENHHNWKGGRLPSGDYIKVLLPRDDELHCMTDRAGYVLEHRLVMAKYLGRPLFKWETVHHKDNLKRHNVITNLQLRIGNHGVGISLKCAACGGINLIPSEL